MQTHKNMRQFLFGLTAFSMIIVASGIRANSADPIDPALPGGNSSGGGSISISQLVIMMYGILERTGFACSPDRDLLQNTLTNASIVSVKRLHRHIGLHYNTLGEPVYDLKDPISDEEQEKLIAWGTPGFIQIKESSSRYPNDWSLDYLIEKRMPFAHFLIHELYRASGKTETVVDAATNRTLVRSVDETFQITIDRYHLDQISILPPVAGTVQSLTITDPAIVTSLINAINWRQGETSAREHATGTHNRGHYSHTDNLYSLGVYTTGGLKFGVPKLMCRTRVDKHKKKYIGPSPYCVVSAEHMVTTDKAITITETPHGCSTGHTESSLWGRLEKDSLRNPSSRIERGITDNGVLMISLRLK